MTTISGIVPILPTPFAERGAIDERSLRSVTRYVVRAGAHGVAFPAVASEFYALSEGERTRATEVVLEEVNGKVPVVVTTSATSAPVAAELSRHATDAGADAVMVMPPYVVKPRGDELRRHFETVAEATDLPIVLQNAPAPLGSASSPGAVVELLRAIPQIHYVKEENLPGGRRISTLLEQAPETLVGVFGGAGGRYIMDELNRGAIGAMPACELTELHVALYEEYQHGNFSAARKLYNRSLPLLLFQAVFRMNMTKEVLRRRGIVANAHVRVGSVDLDPRDHEELTHLLAEVDDLVHEGEARRS